MAMRSIDFAAIRNWSTDPVQYLAQPLTPTTLAERNAYDAWVIKTYWSQWSIDRALSRGAINWDSDSA